VNDSGCAFQLTRRSAGGGAAAHAGFASINAVAEFFRIELLESLANANTLLIRIFRFRMPIS
jgi:hypothetical protein